MAIIVGISGKRGVGKSLLASPYLKAHGFNVYAFADPLKEDVRRFYGLTRDHTDGKLKEEPCHKLGGRTPREAMIAEGKLRRSFSDNGLYWVNKLYEERIKRLPEKQLVAVTDVRFKNEANFLRDHGAIIIRLDRRADLNIYKGTLTDPSECDLDDYTFDLRLGEDRNLTPQSLEKFAHEVVQCLRNLGKL